MKRAARVLLYAGFALAAFCYVCALTGCAPAHDLATPTPEKPRVGCLLATQEQQAKVAGRLLPETVLVIGETPPEDGERWKVIRAPDWNPDEWLPYERTVVRFGAQCQTGNASDFYGRPRAGGRE